ncbi:MAG: hypothetical protein ACPGRE_04860 [Flavobacteriaceae bacterium]
MDYKNKSILARACDPYAAQAFAKAVKKHIGNASYTPTTNDSEFFEKLKEQQWSVVFFAPGACRINARGGNIPGASIETKSWSLEDYKKLIHQLQGNDIQILETLEEKQTIKSLTEALNIARTNN